MEVYLFSLNSLFYSLTLAKGRVFLCAEIFMAFEYDLDHIMNL